MNILLDNTFSTNNYITISDKIKQIPMYFLYFNTIDHFKNLDKNYAILPITNSNQIIKKIAYKIIHFSHPYSCDISPFFTTNKFLKSIYHLFYSAYILHKYHISFTLTNDTDDNNNTPFATLPSYSIPILNNFSMSFYFPTIQFSNIKLFFPLHLLNNPYIPIDIFLITYLIHHDIQVFTDDHLKKVTQLYIEQRQYIIDRQKEENDESIYNYNDIYKTACLSIQSFLNFNVKQIVDYIFDFKYTWTYYSFCYFFIIHYPNELHKNGLYEILFKYITNPIEERNSNIITNIHDILFTNINR
jgi:hypothetical protein